MIIAFEECISYPISWAHFLHPTVIELALSHSLSLSGRTERYSHEFVSDEEDGDYETLEQPFENFTTTTPRMSSYLGESLRLQLEEDSSGSGAESKKDRDSGIVESEPVTILEPTPVKTILGEDDDEEEKNDEIPLM